MIRCLRFNADFTLERNLSFKVVSSYSSKWIPPLTEMYVGREMFCFPREQYFLTKQEYIFLKLTGKVA